MSRDVPLRALDEARAAELDEVAYRAWPAERVQLVSPWRVRVTRGVTRRANSVMPRPAVVGTAPRDVRPSEWALRIDAVERLYRTEGLVSRFQIAPASTPPDLDDLLASRGYEIESPVSIQCVSLRALGRAVGDAQGAEVSASCGRMSESWFDAAARRGRFHDHPDVFAGLLTRLGQRAGFAQAELDGETIATALAVHDARWVGIFAMRTIESFRRRGAGRALLAAIVEWARGRGAAQAYLQVERSNSGAIALYRAAGFVEAYGYHYRQLRRAPTE